MQDALRCPPHKEQVRDGQGPDDGLPVGGGDDGGGVRFFIVTAQLGEHFIIGDPHGDGQTQLCPDDLPQLIRQLPSILAKEVQGTRHVQPALINAEGLHQVGVALIDTVDQLGIVAVLVMVGGEEDQVGTLFPCLPDGFGGLDLEVLGGLVLGQDDAVAGGGVAADRHRFLPQLRMLQQLYRGEKAVQITV